MEAKVYNKDEHGISNEMIDSHAYYILEKLREHGHEAYLVGGSVRDLLLGHNPKDYDISTSARPEQVKKIFSNCILIGRRFRLAHIRFGKKIIEVATFRSGNIQDDTLIVHDNDWGSAMEDVIRRDFTFNGLLYDAEHERVIDYVDGYPDIRKNFLKVIGQPHVRFKQDPVRMIRVVKFIARFGFELCPDAHHALIECRSELTKSSQARVLEELFRMLESGHAKSFFTMMGETGLLQILLPNMGEFLETKHATDAMSYLEEIDSMIKESPRKRFDRSLLLCCVIFPMLERYLNVHFIEGGHVPHLGIIQAEAQTLINETFLPFFKLPRRIKAKMVSILTSQYRITPIAKRRSRKIKAPRVEDFDLAVAFAEIRNRLEPALTESVDQWKEVLKDYVPPKREPRSYPRRGRRRR